MLKGDLSIAKTELRADSGHMNGDNGGSPVHDILFALLLSLLKKLTALLSALAGRHVCVCYKPRALFRPPGPPLLICDCAHACKLALGTMLLHTARSMPTSFTSVLCITSRMVTVVDER